MIFLKELNLQDVEKEYQYIVSVPADENGFINDFYNAPRKNFETAILQPLICQGQGMDLPEGYVPQTHYLLWDDDIIVGWFRLRHYLCPSLINGAGHIGYSIREGFRGKGYATTGLRLMVEKAAKIIPENEIYLSVNKNNPASLRVMLKNGGYIHHEDQYQYYVRIKL
mgnify:FL=1